MHWNTLIAPFRLGGMALALLATQGLAPGALADQSREVETALGRIADSARSVTPTAVSGALGFSSIEDRVGPE